MRCGLLPVFILLAASISNAQSLPATKALTQQGDIASHLVDGVDRFLLRELVASRDARAERWKSDVVSQQRFQESLLAHREQLTHILGMRDKRVPITGLELITSTESDSFVADGPLFTVHRVRWPVLDGIDGEGLLLRPRQAPTGYVVAIPDADQTPEQLCGLQPGISAESQFARRLAEQGFEVVVPALISRQRGVNIFLRDPDITAREFLYRSAYELGRHLVGYEIHKVLAVVDWFAERTELAGGKKPSIGVFGYGEGGMLALYASALDDRIGVTTVSGYFDDRAILWQQPISRNVFGLLERYGDAELAMMISPRTLIVEACDHPEVTLPPGTGGAPAQIRTPAVEIVQREAERARESSPYKNDWLELVGIGAGPAGSPAALTAFVASMRSADSVELVAGAKVTVKRPLPDGEHRLHRQMRQIDQYTQRVLADSAAVRQQFFSKLDTSSAESFAKTVEPYRDYFRHEVIGHFDQELLPANPRTRQINQTEKVTYYEVVLDVFPDVIAYGILCLPRDIKQGERRPVVVCQHGLEGRPQSVIGEKDYHYYKAFATQLAERGFVTFAPQNLYIFKDRFRSLQRKAYPLKKTLFSIIVPQHQQIVDWLQEQPFVDPDRVAFYGLSYGGKTAMRVPPLVVDYCLSICSADFNEWVDKNASTRNPRSYVWSSEYEIFEWDLGSTFNYAEMATLIAPRPFMVERGHSDGVADDWSVGFEFAKVRYLYAHRLKIPGRCEIEWFDGPHSIHGQATFRFLHKHLEWPES